ncbi:MAG: DUF1269 domain-containing protein [Anaerolineales bacterium]|nr:DUF1269 domain-containing protein [Anaerolineales bacterium]
MTTLTVYIFPTCVGVEQLENTLLDLQQRQLIEVQDAAAVIWPRGQKPKTGQLQSLAGPDALSGVFWGMLFGLIFFVPYFGTETGASIGALSVRFSKYGIEHNFIKQTRATVTEGASALFVLTRGAVQDEIVKALKERTFVIIATNLPEKTENDLRGTFCAV